MGLDGQLKFKWNDSEIFGIYDNIETCGLTYIKHLVTMCYF